MLSGIYLLKLCWYWFCIGNFFLWHFLLVLLHYFLHSPIQSWDCHFNVIGLIFPFGTRETNSQSNAGLQKDPLFFSTEVFSSYFFTWQICTTDNFRKEHLCSQRIWKERKRSHTVSGLLRRMLPHSCYLPICSCSMAIFNCSGIPIPGITARLFGSRSSREKTNKDLYLENLYLWILTCFYH